MKDFNFWRPKSSIRDVSESTILSCVRNTISSMEGNWRSIVYYKYYSIMSLHNLIIFPFLLDLTKNIPNPKRKKVNKIKELHGRQKGEL